MWVEILGVYKCYCILIVWQKKINFKCPTYPNSLKHIKTQISDLTTAPCQHLSTCFCYNITKIQKSVFFILQHPLSHIFFFFFETYKRKSYTYYTFSHVCHHCLRLFLFSSSCYEIDDFTLSNNFIDSIILPPVVLFFCSKFQIEIKIKQKNPHTKKKKGK